jgi:hypothetical protein
MTAHKLTIDHDSFIDALDAKLDHTLHLRCLGSERVQ